MSDLLSAALAYIADGLRVIPIPHKEKGPRIAGWQALNITAETAPKYFNGGPSNIGVGKTGWDFTAFTSLTAGTNTRRITL
jgi:hypothetical protein